MSSCTTSSTIFESSLFSLFFLNCMFEQNLIIILYPQSTQCICSYEGKCLNIDKTYKDLLGFSTVIFRFTFICHLYEQKFSITLQLIIFRLIWANDIWIYRCKLLIWNSKRQWFTYKFKKYDIENTLCKRHAKLHENIGIAHL